MLDQLYLERDDQKYGPFSTAQVRKLAASGQVRPTDLVWKEGMEAGVPAAKVKSLFPDLPAANPDAPAGAPVLPPAVKSLPPQTPLPDRVSSPPPAPASVPAASPERAGYQLPGDAALVPVGGRTDWELAASNSPTAPDKPVAQPTRPVPPPQPVRKRRAVAVSGVIIVNQDGVVVRFRKKCTKCGCEDGTTTNMPIPHGTTRASFFCPKCRKLRDVQIQGMG